MKKLSILIVILLAVSQFGLQAQTYKLNKQIYNHREYLKQPIDPNNPAVAGIASFFIPGLGQMISGETGRGLGFLGGYLGCAVLTGVGYGQFISSNLNNSPSEISTAGTPLMLIGMLGSATVGIWSIVDAVKVAKVNNMYFQDKYGSSIKLEFAPYIDYASYGLPGQGTPIGGLSMQLKF